MTILKVSGAAPALLLATALLAASAGADDDRVTAEPCRGTNSNRVRHYPGDSNATSLYMNGCGLTVVNNRDIEHLDNVKFIDLRLNSLAHFDTSALRTVPALTELQLSSNQFRSPPVFAAGSCDRLTKLNLYSNLLTALRDEGTFSACIKLTYLYLGDNQIEYLHPDIFKSLIELKILDLHRNKINFIPNYIFASNGKLKIVYLNNNRLTHLPPEFASSLKRVATGLENVYFNDNPWHCACLVELMLDARRAGVVYDDWHSYDGTRPECVYSGAEPHCRRESMLAGAGAGAWAVAEAGSGAEAGAGGAR